MILNIVNHYKVFPVSSPLQKFQCTTELIQQACCGGHKSIPLLPKWQPHHWIIVTSFRLSMVPVDLQFRNTNKSEVFAKFLWAQFGKTEKDQQVDALTELIRNSGGQLSNQSKRLAKHTVDQ